MRLVVCWKIFYNVDVGAIWDYVTVRTKSTSSPDILLPLALASVLVEPATLVLAVVVPGNLVVHGAITGPLAVPVVEPDTLVVPAVVVGVLMLSVVMPFCHGMEEVTSAPCKEFACRAVATGNGCIICIFLF